MERKFGHRERYALREGFGATGRRAATVQIHGFQHIKIDLKTNVDVMCVHIYKHVYMY